MKKCIVIPDSFKGSLDSIDLCAMAKEKIRKFFPDCETVTVPVADGGEGTVECFLQAMQGERVSVPVHGPYMEPAEGFYGRFGDLAVLEMAAAAGLPMVGDRKDPSVTTTYGVGELIRHAAGQGARRIILGMGGSCTNDGGCGCAAALGTRFTGANGKEFIPTGRTLGQVRGIDPSETRRLLEGVEITAMCDVENPLYGEKGAAYIFGPQKGADADMVALLDGQLRLFGETLREFTGTDVARIPGSGAAGGLGAGVVAFLGAELRSGIETVLDIVGFDGKLAGADAVFTGEGKIDGQSLAGKVVSGVSKRAKAQNVPVYAVVGDVGDDAYGAYDLGVTAIFSINRVAVPFSVARTRSRQDFAAAFEDILRLIASCEARQASQMSR